MRYPNSSAICIVTAADKDMFYKWPPPFRSLPENSWFTHKADVGYVLTLTSYAPFRFQPLSDPPRQP
jgi:hypothetical protein